MDEPRETWLLVDGEYLFDAPKRVANRAPHREERIDYGYLFKWATGKPPKNVKAIYFQQFHESAKPFYNALGGFGYELKLSPAGRGGALATTVTHEMLKGLAELEQRGGDIVFVGGADYDGQVTDILSRIAKQQRRVQVVFFRGWCEIQGHEFEFVDIGSDVHAMATTIYPSETGWQDGASSRSSQPGASWDRPRDEGWRSSDETLAPGSADPPNRHIGMAEPGRASARSELRTAMASADSRTRSADDLQRPVRSVEAGTPTLVIVDVPSMEQAIGTVLSRPGGGADKDAGKGELAAQAFWRGLHRFARQRSGGGTVGILALNLHDATPMPHSVPGWSELDEFRMVRVLGLSPESISLPGLVDSVEVQERPRSPRRRRGSNVQPDLEASNSVAVAVRIMLQYLIDTNWGGDLLLATNDGSHARALSRPTLAAMARGVRRTVTILAFTEDMSDEEYDEFAPADEGPIELLDLETDVGALRLPSYFSDDAVDVRALDPASLLQDVFGGGAAKG